MIYVLMPVLNRIALTMTMLACLRAQRLDEALSLIVVDDGSNDGSAEFLRAQPDVTVLHGDGSLWWGGAIDFGLRHALAKAADQDWILFVNNDTTIKNGFVQALLDAAREHAPAAVGSVIRDATPPHRLLSIGPVVNPWRFRVADKLDGSLGIPGNETGCVSVDALSGRGVLFPVAALRSVRGMRPRWLPHYLADYELAMRAKKAGWRLLVSFSAVVYSADDYGNAYRSANLRERLFSARSPSYLPARLVFWWSASSSLQRVTLPVRAVACKLISLFRKKA